MFKGQKNISDKIPFGREMLAKKKRFVLLGQKAWYQSNLNRTLLGEHVPANSDAYKGENEEQKVLI